MPLLHIVISLYALIFPPGSAKSMARISIRPPLTSETEASFIAGINLIRPALLFHHWKLFSGTKSKFKARRSRKPDTWITRRQRSASEMKLKAKSVCSRVLPDRGRREILTQGATHRRRHRAPDAALVSSLLLSISLQGSCLALYHRIILSFRISATRYRVDTRHVFITFFWEF